MSGFPLLVELLLLSPKKRVIASPCLSGDARFQCCSWGLHRVESHGIQVRCTLNSGETHVPFSAKRQDSCRPWSLSHKIEGMIWHPCFLGGGAF
ncbi:hypothetical protein HDV63DRAFT_384426 [Trichoderma sp. SZMC 28014]